MVRQDAQEIGLLAELAEAQNNAAFFHAASPTFAAEHGLYLEEAPAYTAGVVKSSDLANLNCVLNVGTAKPISAADLDHISGIYKHAGAKPVFRLSPQAQPLQLPQTLLARGFIHQGDSAKLYWTGGALPQLETKLIVARASAEQANEFTRISCGPNQALQEWLGQTFGKPGWYHYLAFVADTAIATGALYVENDLGYIGWAATRPEYRRQGAQTALLAYRMREASKLGCKLLIADTGADTPARPNSSFHNMLRCGFQLAYLRPRFVLSD